jgi:hypothetical protein
VRLTTSHRKTLLLRNLNRGGRGPIWAVAPLDGWMTTVHQCRRHAYQDRLVTRGTLRYTQKNISCQSAGSLFIYHCVQINSPVVYQMDTGDSLQEQHGLGETSITTNKILLRSAYIITLNYSSMAHQSFREKNFLAFYKHFLKI